MSLAVLVSRPLPSPSSTNFLSGKFRLSKLGHLSLAQRGEVELGRQGRIQLKDARSEKASPPFAAGSLDFCGVTGGVHAGSDGLLSGTRPYFLGLHCYTVS